MKLTLTFAFSFLFILIAFKSFATPKEQWELEFDKEGIRVYTQLEGTSPYKQIKVTTTINAPLEKVMEILMAFGNYSSWMNQVYESYLVNQVDSSYYVFYLKMLTGRCKTDIRSRNWMSGSL